jgi:hypothetical protein
MPGDGQAGGFGVGCWYEREAGPGVVALGRGGAKADADSGGSVFTPFVDYGCFGGDGRGADRWVPRWSFLVDCVASRSWHSSILNPSHAEALTDRQRHRLDAVFADERHVEVEATWGIYQRIIAAYRDPDRTAAKTELTKIITAISRGVPTALTELITLGRTLKRRAADVLAYFDRPGTSNGPTEAINGRLEHLRGSALGFRNLTKTTSPDRCSKPAASGTDYTLNRDEPLKLARHDYGLGAPSSGANSCPHRHFVDLFALPIRPIGFCQYAPSARRR